MKTDTDSFTIKARKYNLSKIIFIVIMVSFGITTTTYSLLSPALEASDETWHYQYIKEISDGTIDYKFIQSTHHPPLYYLINSVFLHFIDYPDIIEIEWNPTLDLIHVNYHSVEERFPYTGTALAVHVLRFFSIFCGLVTLYFTYKITKFLFPKNIWLQLLPVATVALLPHYTGNGSSVLNNDVLVPVFTTISMFYLLRFLANTDYSKFLIISGIFAGLAILTKTNVLLIYPIFLIFFLYLLFSKQIKIKLFFKSVSIFGITSLIGGGWYLIFQKFTGTGIIPPVGTLLEGTLDGNIVSKITWDRVVNQIISQIWTYGGWHNFIKIPSYFSDIGIFLIAVSIIGLFLILIKKTKLCKTQLERNQIVVLIISTVVMFLGVLYLDARSSLGVSIRYIAPFISSYAILFSLGLFVFFDKGKLRLLSILPIIFLVVLTFTVLTIMYGVFDHGLKPLPVDPSIDPFKTISDIYKKRADLQQSYSKNNNIDYPNIINWASKQGFMEYDVLNRNKPLYDLLNFYYSDEEIQNKFPNIEDKSEVSSLVKYVTENGVTPELDIHHRYFMKYNYAVQTEGSNDVCASTKFTSYQAVTELKKVFCKRYDLLLAFPSVYQQNHLGQLFQWADTFGYKEEKNLSEHEPFYLMMRVYYSDEELQNEFPEARNAENVDEYLKWVINNGVNENEILKSNSEYYLNFEKHNSR